MFFSRRIRPGDFYEDCDYHPVLCTEADRYDIAGISLVDGSMPRSCSLKHCSVKKLNLEQAIELREVWAIAMPLRLHEIYRSKHRFEIISLTGEYWMTISGYIDDDDVVDRGDIFVLLNTYFEASGRDMEITTGLTETVAALILIKLFCYGFITKQQIVDVYNIKPRSFN